MRAAWIAFATNGDPGWPTFDSGLVQIFDADPVVATYPEVESRKIWQDHTFAPRCRSERRDRVDRRAGAAGDRPITAPGPHLDVGVAYHTDGIAPASQAFLAAARRAGRAMR